MGRVDDALRRAAEGHKDGEVPVVSPPDPAVEVLDPEAFPVEIPDRRESRPAGSLTIDRDGSAPAQPVPVKSGAQSIFERLDARVAGKIVVDQGMLPASRE